MTYVVIDFETASAVDIKKCGAAKYAECPTTEVLCIGYSLDGGPPVVVRPEWLQVTDNPTALQILAADPTVTFVAFNCIFEKAIWRNIMVKQYGWPDIPNSRWHDAQAVCAMKGIPLKLERAAVALRLSEQTNPGHTRLVTAPSRPNKRGEYDRSPETLGRVYSENEQDVRCEVELHQRVGALQPCERNVWLLDQRINERGVAVDLAFVAACQRVIDGATGPAVKAFREITGGINPTQRDAVVAWVRDQGVDIPNLQKGTIDAMLGVQEEDDDDGTEDDSVSDGMPVLPDKVKSALSIRRKVGSASIKKLAAIRNSACADGRVRGVVQYHGAGPGRWVGRLFQPQNFPRGSLLLDKKSVDPELVVQALMSGDYTYVDALFGDSFEVVVSGLRHAIISSPGRMITVGDYATVEARLVLALAGAADALAIISDTSRDVYAEMAEPIFDLPAPRGKEAIKLYKEAHLAERQTGKNTVLGCGFQMGWKKFKSRYAADRDDDFAKKCVDAYRKDFAPEVPELWYALQEAACKAVWDHTTTEAYGIQYRHEDIWLTCRLRSGRKLYYPYPEKCKKAMPWDETDIRPAWTSKASKNGKWITRNMYGGLLTENVVQASARDLLTDAMFKCEKNNLPVVLTVHDEVVTEPLQQFSDPAMLKQIMEDRPAWAVEMGVPVASEVWSGGRYKK